MNSLFTGLLACTMGLVSAADETILMEAEAFPEVGGWSIDTAFTQIVGSPYLLAHGLGRPVKDAVGKVTVRQGGSYRVWVRTKDWVAPWKAPGTPGRFQVLVNDKPLSAEFGTVGADWHWQDGGTVEMKAGESRVALHDLTGFDGRCDAILFSNQKDFTPPHGKELASARKRWAGLPAEPEDAGEFDLVVVGGGYAGMASAISAARQSLKVALVQDRFVLGGNGSSEVRVWAMGGTLRGKYPHLGEIVEEFADHSPDSPGNGVDFGDERKEQVIRREKNLKLFLGNFVMGVELAKESEQEKSKLVSKGYESPSIKAVTSIEVRTGRERRFRAKYFVDCTGHGVVGALANARYRMLETGHLGMSNMWYWQQEASAQAWPKTPWALDLDLSDFPKNVRSSSEIDGKPFMKGEWFWESGFNKHPVNDLELIRDWNLRAVFGAFSAIKHGKDKDAHANAQLKWVAHVGGPRESRLLDGDIILSRADITSAREFPDGFVPTTWDIDLHYPKEQFAKKFPDNPFISRAEFGAGVDRKNGYPVPYRCFYSKNVPNLFMAGRCISVNHEALGTVRVMRTCGMMGEVVGKAAYLCVKNNATPREVYSSHLEPLTELVRQPGAMRRDSMDAPLYRDPEIAPVAPYFSKSTDKVTGKLIPKTDGKPRGEIVELKSLPGIVVDDTQAKLTGKWGETGGLTPFVGEGYRYASPGEKAEARFPVKVPKAGKYELRMAWAPHENRATKALVILEREGQAPLKLRVNQREATTDPKGFHSLGMFDFPAGTVEIILSNDGVNGNIHADAVQLLEVK